MPMTTLAVAHALVPGARLVGDPATPIARVHSDTRTLQAGDAFVALRGERFDAADFLADARRAGAVAAIAERGIAAAGLAGLEVADARGALGALAAGWRRRFAAMPLVAVAGSNGKTTTTQMIAAVFRAWHGEAALATRGNFNNDIGLPLTLLGLREGAHRIAVVELGMNHPGEIARLAAIAAPSVAVVTNAQREHLEFMADVDAVARENGAAIAALAADGVAVFPADDAQASTWRALAGARRTVTFALDGAADVVLSEAHATTSTAASQQHLAIETPAGLVESRLAVLGAHNVRNALAATAAAFAVGCPLAAIERGLADFRPVRGRSERKAARSADGAVATLIDDSYNANPDSVRAAIDLLATLPPPRWLVLGDMGEVGSQGPAFHREVGAHARERGIEALWAAGEESANVVAGYAVGAARPFATVDALVAALDARPAFRSALVKGSRFMAMERVVAALAVDPRT